MLYPILLAASLVVAVAGDLYDVITSEKCFAKGAVEGNSFLIGDNQRPSAVKLYLRDSLELGFAVLPTVLCATVFHNLPLAYGALTGPVILGIKHYRGGLAGTAFLAGKPWPEPQTAWQKFWQG
jgi:hypothetical protein